MSVAKKSTFLKSLCGILRLQEHPSTGDSVFCSGFFFSPALSPTISAFFSYSGGSFTSCGWSLCLWSLVEPNKVGAGSITSSGDLADQAIIHTSGALAVLGLVSTSQMMQLGLWPDKGHQ